MDFNIFSTIVDECRAKKPILFGLEHDKVLCVEEIVSFENTAHITLSDKYKEFIMYYGGGYFGYANIYSLDENSNFYLLKHNAVPFDKYVRIADNGCGDYYLHCIKDGKCIEPLFIYDHETKNVTPSMYKDVFEYLVAVGLKE